MNDQPQSVPVATAGPSQAASVAMWVHLAGFAGIIPFGNIAGPLVVWMATREKYPAIEVDGKEAVNFQITMSILFCATYVVTMLLSVLIAVLPRGMAAGGFGIAVLEIVAYIAIVAFWLTVVILAAYRASQGQPYRYPLSIRFIK